MLQECHVYEHNMNNNEKQQPSSSSKNIHERLILRLTFILYSTVP